MARWVTGTGQELLNVHNSEVCTGWCVIHNPLPGPWESWPTNWRGDQRVLGILVDIWRGFERICPHGVGHPAPEEILRNKHEGVHACDGCPCGPGDAYVKSH